jgi:hypothetical protein
MRHWIAVPVQVTVAEAKAKTAGEQRAPNKAPIKNIAIFIILCF